MDLIFQFFNIEFDKHINRLMKLAHNICQNFHNTALKVHVNSVLRKLTCKDCKKQRLVYNIMTEAFGGKLGNNSKENEDKNICYILFFIINKLYDLFTFR